MFKNTFQSGFLSILYSIGSKPLQIWDKQVRNGHIKRITDQVSAALEHGVRKSTRALRSRRASVGASGAGSERLRVVPLRPDTPRRLTPGAPAPCLIFECSGCAASLSPRRGSGARGAPGAPHAPCPALPLRARRTSSPPC